MARIRTVKPDFFRSLDTRALSLHARLTYIGLWTYVDDDGRGAWDVPVIRGDIWPDEDSGIVLGALQELSRKGQIVVYESGGRTYFHIPAFRDHQRIDKPRPSVLPGPDDEGSEPVTCENEPAGSIQDDSQTLPGTIQEASRLEGKGREGERRGRDTPTAPLAPLDGGAPGADLVLADETPNKRAQRLARTYTDRVKLSNFPAVMGVVKKAMTTYDDETITAALSRLATEGRSVTTETLRIEIEGLPVRPSRQQQATDGLFDRAMQRAEALERGAS